MTNNKETKMTKTQEQLRQEGLRAARNMVRKFKAHEKARKNPKQGLTNKPTSGTIQAYKTTTTNERNTMDIITITMLATLLIPLAMIGVSDAKRHPWFKQITRPTLGYDDLVHRQAT